VRACRRATAALAAASVGCNAVAGLGDIAFSDGGSAPAPSGAAGSGAQGAGGAGAGGAAACGNGTLDPGEECDDGNATDGDGCTKCVVDCSEPDAFKLKDTHHCYWFVELDASWSEARGKCALAGADLVAFSTDEEHAAVIGFVSAGHVWTGGNDNAVDGTYVWSNGERWIDTLWASGYPIPASDYNCVAMVGRAGMLLNNYPCKNNEDYVCERTPAKLGP
jgi:cysteine-rich repeat protein